MATSRFQGRARWETLGAVILTLAAGGAGYAHAQGESARSEAPPTSPTSRADEVQMSMPGMQMGPAAETRPSAASRPPDHVPITITPRVQQGIGVTIGRAHLAPLEMTIRTVGIVRPNETKVANIYVKTDGWVEKLFVSYTGQTVRAGDPLLTIYSPEFLVAQQEYLTALRAPKESMPTAPGQPSLIESSRRQLEFWDVPSPEIEELKRRGTPMKTLTLRCSIGGTVLEKNTFEGQRVSVRDKLYVVADLSTVWVQGKIYEYELPHVEVGQPATVTLPALPLHPFAGKVVFIDPVVDERARTVRVRIELPNPDGLLKPGMFSYVALTHPMREGLVVRTSAVIRTGERDIVFRVEPENWFVPIEVKISPLRFAGDYFQVLEGLKAGEQVATSANFLIDTESRLRAGGGAIAGMAGMPGMEMGPPQGRQSKEATAEHGGTMKGMETEKMKDR